MTFLLTKSKNIGLLTIRYIKDRKEETLLESVDDVFLTYNNAGFEMKQFHADNEFVFLKPYLKEIGIEPNVCAAGEHVPQIERMVRLVKRKVQGTVSQLALQLLAQDYDN